MNTFHFIFGLRPQTEAFHLAFYLCLESCRQVNAPAEIHFHYRNEPYGPWWERIRPYLVLRHIEGKTAGFAPERYASSAEGRFIEQAGISFAHEADFLRMEILIAEGGCYADMDTLFVQAYPQRFFEGEFVIGEERAFVGDDGILRPSLCNAVMFAQPGARFARAWLARMGEAFDGTWNRHSCFEAARLWDTLPDAVQVLPHSYFYRHTWTPRGIQTLFEACDRRSHADLYSIHLWAHLWWSETRRDFTDFHAGLITPEFVRSVDTTYNLIARRFLPVS